MIHLSNISKSFGVQVIFNDASLAVNSGERIGLLGRNGSGKSTLFNIITGSLKPDQGTVTHPNDYKIACMEQIPEFTRETVLEEACASLPGCEEGTEWKAKKVLFGLGFTQSDILKSPGNVSGGYKVRLNLVKAIISEPGLLLLDEPNNYLDVLAIRWLKGFLKSWKSELILITHDRDFMDSVVTHTAVIHRNTIKKYTEGSRRALENIQQEEELIDRLRGKTEKKQKDLEKFITRFRAKARHAGLVQSRIKTLQKLHVPQGLEKAGELRIDFNYEYFNSSYMMRMKNIIFAYGPETPILIDGLTLDVRRGEKICIIGKNGKGKSTLMKILAQDIQPNSGNISYGTGLKVGYYPQDGVARMDPDNTLLEEILSCSQSENIQGAKKICGALMMGGEQCLKKISLLSGGEKSRVLLGKILSSPCHMLLLDEPTNHLDMESCDIVADAIMRFKGSVVMVTHNQMFLRKIADKLVVFDESGISFFNGGYEQFLDKIGWESETSCADVTDENSSIVERKKKIKKELAELRQEKYSKISPVKEDISRIEQKVQRCEEETHSNTAALIEASSKGDPAAIREFSKKDRIFRDEIDKLYEELMEKTEHLERLENEYRNKIQRVEKRG